jgi:hypothetical protein
LHIDFEPSPIEEFRMDVQFYRYISYPGEVDQIAEYRKIHSTNPRTAHATWYSLLRLDDAAEAQACYPQG